MIVIVGESASGKSTIEKELCKRGYKKVISYTTRKPRQGEVDGFDYHFITVEDFREKQKNGFFAETGEYNGWLYGSAVKDCTNDKVAVLTPHGMRQLKKNKKLDIFCVYIKTKRRTRLIRMLTRGDNIEEIKRRDASDIGQFDGIEDEVDNVIENEVDNVMGNEDFLKYFLTPHLEHMYNQHLVKKQSSKKTILCDIDEVINNLIERLLIEYNQKYNDNLKFEDIKEWDIEKSLKPECKDFFKEFGTDEILSSLELQPKAKETIEYLMEKYNFYFVTSTHPNHIKVRDEWLKKKIPQYNSNQLIVCSNKKLIHGDYIIDDYLNNFVIEHSEDSPVKYNIVFDKPWNRELQEDNVKTFRVQNWEEIKKIIDRLESFDGI